MNPRRANVRDNAAVRLFHTPYCADYQYHGTHTWPVVRAKHHANLMFVLDDLAGWESAIGYRHEDAIGIAHSLRLAHTVAVNGFFSSLVGLSQRT